MKQVCFYRETQPFGELCNFFTLSSPIIYKGKSYPTSEHLYQALKYSFPGSPSINNKYMELIGKASTPNKSKILANQSINSRYHWQKQLSDTIHEYQKLGIKTRPDWEKAKVFVMRLVLRLKFQTDKHCKQVLLSTGDAQLVEDSPHDYYWGRGSKGNGTNMLGKLLMEIRSEIMEEESSQADQQTHFLESQETKKRKTGNDNIIDYLLNKKKQHLNDDGAKIVSSL